MLERDGINKWQRGRSLIISEELVSGVCRKLFKHGVTPIYMSIWSNGYDMCLSRTRFEFNSRYGRQYFLLIFIKNYNKIYM